MSRVVVIGLDGLPCSLLKRFIAEGVMPEMGKLMSQGSLASMETVYPPLSSLSWTTFFTGVNPGKHRIFGFFESQIDDYGIWFQNLSDVKMPGLWDYAQDCGKRTISINLPGTYPAPPFNGVMVSGFIANELPAATYPKMLLPLLEKINYMLDVPCDKPHLKPGEFWQGVEKALSARAQIISTLLQHEPFDLFVGVLTETDRVQHFFYDAIEEPSHPQHAAAMRFYSAVDRLVGQWVRQCRPDDEIVILADHGFCRIQQEIYINHWLKEKGYLVMKGDAPGLPLKEIDPEKSRAFSLDPGRIFINLKGRQAHGCVEPADYHALREEIAAGIAQWEISVPWSPTPFRPITHVFRREEIYQGPYLRYAADLVLHTVDGFDMKGKFNHPGPSQQSSLTGMHTYGDATLWVRGKKIKVDQPKMVDVPATLLHLLGVPVPPHFEGRVLV